MFSLILCIAASILLVSIGGETKYGLYVGTGTNMLLRFILNREHIESTILYVLADFSIVPFPN